MSSFTSDVVRAPDVGSYTRYLLFTKYRLGTVAILLSVCGVVYVAYALRSFEIALSALGIPVIYFEFLRRKALLNFKREFAAIHGFTFAESAAFSTIRGRLFDASGHHTQSFANVMAGTIENRPVQIFEFHYKMGSGKSERAYQCSVCEIRFEGADFPFIQLQARTMRRHGDVKTKGFDQDREVPLETPYTDRFILLTQQKYEIEALQIFSHETLAFLAETAPDFSIEFAKDALYIYDDKNFYTNEELLKLCLVAERLVALAGPRIDSLRDDFAAMHERHRM